MGEFNDKVVLITGGNSGLGQATAEAFIREGAKVVISARGAERGEALVRQLQAGGAEATFIACNVANRAQVEGLVNRVIEKYGRIDCAFNNAGTHGARLTDLHEYEEEDFDDVLGTNLKGVWLCMKYELGAMLAQAPKGGVIVNTSSINGLGGVRRGSLYSASKAGVLALTKAAAQEYAIHGIRVNALVAGPFDTPMLASALREMAGNDPQVQAALEAQQKQFIPLQRIGLPQEAADAVLWLCSERSSYVTGNSLIVDGGISSLLR